MFETTENQIAFVQQFFDELKTVKKEFTTIQKNHNKPEKTKKPRKNKKNNTDTESDFVADLIEIANSDVIPENVTGEPIVTVTSQKDKKQKKARKNKNEDNPLVSLINNIQETSENVNGTETQAEPVEGAAEPGAAEPGAVEPGAVEPVAAEPAPKKVSNKKQKKETSPVAENTVSSEPRRDELEKMAAQQLRDIWAVFKGKPAGLKSCAGAKNKKELIDQIIAFENERNPTNTTTTTTNTITISEPEPEPVSEPASEPMPEMVQSEPVAVVVEKKEKKVIKKKEKKQEKKEESAMNEPATVIVETNNITNELSYEAIDLNSLYTFVHNEIEYLRDDDYNLYCPDNLEKVGRFENNIVIEI